MKELGEDKTYSLYELKDQGFLNDGSTFTRDCLLDKGHDFNL